MRPISLFSFFTVLAGYLISSHSWHIPPLVLMEALVLMLITSFGMAWNNFQDRQMDLKKGRSFAYNNPGKSLALTLVLLVISVTVLPQFTGKNFNLACTIMAVILFWYSYISRIILVDNLIVAAFSAWLIIVTTDNIFQLSSIQISLTLIIFLLILGREILKDVEDVKIDRGYRNSIPIMFGKANAINIISLSWFLCSVVVIYIWFLSQLSAWRFFVASSALALFISLIIIRKDSGSYKTTKGYIYLAMVLMLVGTIFLV